MMQQVQTSSDNTQVLDPGSLEHLRELGRKAGLHDFLSRMARTSLDQPPSMESFRRALAARDARTVGILAHSMRGTFGAFGAVRLSAFCREIEKLAKNGDLVRCRARLGGLQQEYERVETALRLISNESWVPSC